MEKIFYFAQVVNGLHSAFAFMCVIGSIATIVVTILTIVNAVEANGNDEYSSLKREALLNYKVFRKWTVRLWCFLSIAIVGCIFIPSKQTYLFMVGGNAVDKIVEKSPEIKEIPSNTLELLNEYIKAETEKVRNKALLHE